MRFRKVLYNFVLFVLFTKLFAEYLHVCRNKEEYGPGKHEHVEQTMHVPFVYPEYRRAKQARDKSGKIDDACCRRDAFWREIRGEERRKHQSAYNECRRNRNFSENIESIKT